MTKDIEKLPYFAPKRETYLKRIEHARKLAAEVGLDALLLGDPSNLKYFAGVGGLSPVRPVFLLIPCEGDCELISPKIEAETVSLESWIKNMTVWVEWTEPPYYMGWIEPIEAVVKRRKLQTKRIGIEYGFLRIDMFQEMRAHLPEVFFTDAAPVVDAVRIRKDAIEIEILRLNGQVGMAQLEGARSAIKPGVTEYEVGLSARAAGARKAADLIGPDYHEVSPIISGIQIVASGIHRSARAHATASTYRIRQGEVVQLCYCGCVFYHYHLGFDRPIVAGGERAGDAQEEILKIALEAHHAAMDSIKPGVRADEVNEIAQSVFRKYGLENNRLHRTGRGVGAAEVEKPELKEADHTILEPGMTITVEPGLYIPGVGGGRFGDTVVVTESGCENLTPAKYC